VCSENKVVLFHVAFPSLCVAFTSHRILLLAQGHGKNSNVLLDLAAVLLLGDESEFCAEFHTW
jgi:hypothetical protein